MTIYEFNVITTTGFPYYGLKINEIPNGVRISLRFFDFSKDKCEEELIDPESKVELTAGLIAAIFEFSRAIDRKIYMLEFQSEGANPINDNVLDGPISDTLITCSSESYLNQEALRQKIELIYKTIIEPRAPLMFAEELLPPEEDVIENILNDKKARDYLLSRVDALTKVADMFLLEKDQSGLEQVCVLSFDLSLIHIFGKKYSFRDVEKILRKMSQAHEIPIYGIKQRIINYKGEIIWVYINNSGGGVTESYMGEKLFEPYYYLYICKPESHLEDIYENIMNKLNEIIKK